MMPINFIIALAFIAAAVILAVILLPKRMNSDTPSGKKPPALGGQDKQADIKPLPPDAARAWLDDFLVRHQSSNKKSPPGHTG